MTGHAAGLRRLDPAERRPAAWAPAPAHREGPAQQIALAAALGRGQPCLVAGQAVVRWLVLPAQKPHSGSPGEVGSAV